MEPIKIRIENRFRCSAYDDGTSSVSGRICLFSEEQVKHAVKYFEKEYQEYFQP